MCFAVMYQSSMFENICIGRQTDRHIDTQTDRQTSRQTDKQTDRQADRLTDRLHVLSLHFAPLNIIT